MKTLNDKLYEKFSIDERLQLTIAALARQDQEEVDKLRNTCEQRTYITHDLRYTGKIKEAERKTRGFVILASQLLNQINASKLIIWGVRLAYHAHENDFDRGYEFGCERKIDDSNYRAYLDDIKVIYEQISNQHEHLQEHIVELKAVYQAFIELCAKEGFNFEHLLSWFKVFELQPEILVYLKCDAVVTNERVTFYKDAFKEF